MSLAHIIGHTRQLSVIQGALRRGAVAPSYLFFGPPGVGKRTAALEFARALLCDDGGDDSCGRCTSCLSVGQSPHPDFVFATPEKKVLKIDQVRKVQDFLSLTPAWGHRTVALLDPAEALNIEAANALLKTLEEPPPGSVIILISANLGGLPATVISRCQKVSFGCLRDSEVERVLRVQGVAGDQTGAAAGLAEGSPGMVLSLESEAWKKSRSGLERFLKAVSGGDKGLALAQAEGFGGGREEAEIMVRLLLGETRRELRGRAGLEEAAGEGRMKSLEKTGDEALLGLAAGLVEAAGLLRGNSNVKLVLGDVFTKWIDESHKDGIG